MPILMLALLALGTFIVIGILCLTAVICESRKSAEDKAQSPAAPKIKHA